MTPEELGELDGVGYLREMYDRMEPDGRVRLQGKPREPAIYLDWDEEDVPKLAMHLAGLAFALRELAEAEEGAELPEVLQEVWDTYIRPFPPHGLDAEKVQNLSEKVEGAILTAEELALQDRLGQWMAECALQRLPYGRTHPLALIQRARRYKRLVELRAPKIIIRNEERMLAEELVLYYHQC